MSSTPDLVILRERGAFETLGDMFSGEGCSPFVVASMGARRRFRLDERIPRESIFSEFHANPTFEQAVRAAHLREKTGARVVVGIGGGSTMDVAKAARAFSGDVRVSQDILERRCAPGRPAKLVLVPTTAGSGSEVTQFATLYRDGLKVSVDDADVRADTVIVDPELAETCSRDVTWSCAFDALAHSIESYWSIRSDDESRRLAEAALHRLVPILRHAREVPSPGQRDVLAEVSMLAGMAINITRTTAAHALAYPLTVHFGIPHGVACALNLTWLASLIEAARPEHVVDRRGPRMVSRTVKNLRRMLEAERDDLGDSIRRLMVVRGFSTRLNTGGEPHRIERVVEEGFCSPRLSGTPIHLDAKLVLRAMVEISDSGKI